MKTKITFFIMTGLLLIALNLQGQSPDPPSQPQNRVAEAHDTKTTKTYRTRSHAAEATYQGYPLELTATGYTGESPGVYIHREDLNGISNTLLSITPDCATSGANQINDIDVIIGNNGQTILAIYQVLGSIDFHRYVWNGTGYTYQNCGHIAPDSSPDAPFGSPRLDIDHPTGSIIITFKSYNNGNPQPYYYPTTVNQPGTGTKQVLTSNALPANYDLVKGPVAVSLQEKANANPVAHFSLTYIPSGVSKEVLVHVSTPYITSNGSLSNNFIHDEKLLKANKTEGESLQWSSIDNWWNDSGFESSNENIEMESDDYWTIAVIHNIPSQSKEIVKAFTGRGLSQQGYVMHNVSGNLDFCKNSTVDIAYVSDVINITWESSNCSQEEDLEGENILTWTMNYYGRNPGLAFHRVNNNLAMDAIHPSTAGHDSKSINAWLSRNNDSVYLKFPHNSFNWKNTLERPNLASSNSTQISVNHGTNGDIIFTNTAHFDVKFYSSTGK